jgi:hypothetical protein
VMGIVILLVGSSTTGEGSGNMGNIVETVIVEGENDTTNARLHGCSFSTGSIYISQMSW